MKNWDDLRYYLAVARRRSVSAAASELRVSHATVLRRIDKLEEDVNATLFKRLQSGYQLSDVGETLYQRVAQIESEILSLESQVQGQDEQIAGILRVSQPSDGSLNLYPLYAEFLRQYPEVQLKIVPSLGSNINLNRHEADVAIWFTEEPPELLVGQCAGAIRFSAYTTPAYLERFDGDPELSEVDWIIQAQTTNDWGGIGSRSAYSQMFQLVAEPKIAVEAATYTDTIPAVREGLGAGFLSHVFASARAELVPLPGCPIVAQREVWVLAHRNLRHMNRVRYFMRFIVEGLKQQLALKDG